MLNPNIGKLMEEYDNRYRLVIQVARTAREISQEAGEEDRSIVEKSVSAAIDKLASKI